jgi:hypothetical protein
MKMLSDNPAEGNKALHQISAKVRKIDESATLNAEALCDMRNAATALAAESPSTQYDHQALSCDDAFGAFSLYTKSSLGRLEPNGQRLRRMISCTLTDHSNNLNVWPTTFKNTPMWNISPMWIERCIIYMYVDNQLGAREAPRGR